jgi:hypothetical protein
MDNSRETQIEEIKNILHLPWHFSVEYNKKEDSIHIGNSSMCLTIEPKQLDRDDYLDVVKFSYGRLMEALDDHLLRMPVMGHA